MSIRRVLADVGLQDTEARFYLAALELGQASVRDVAAKADITRTNAYDVFARLLEQGLVTQVGDASSKSMMVAAEPPDRLGELLEARRRKLESLLPELRSLHNRASGKPRVRFYQGLEGIKQVLNETLTVHDKRLCSILSMKDLFEVPGRAWMDELVRRRIDSGVFLRVIRSPVKDVPNVWPDSPQDLREMRFAPLDFVFTMTSYIYDNKVAIIASRRENFAMTIESEEFTAMQRNLFEVLWASCPRSNRQASEAVAKPRLASSGARR